MSEKRTAVSPGSKDLATGVVYPPLPHDLYAERHAKEAAADLKRREEQQRAAAKAQNAARLEQDEEAEERAEAERDAAEKSRADAEKRAKQEAADRAEAERKASGKANR